MSLIVIVTNKSGLSPVSDYHYEVLVGDGTVERSVTLAKGRVEGHTRTDGWKALIQKVLDAEEPRRVVSASADSTA